MFNGLLSPKLVLIEILYQAPSVSLDDTSSEPNREVVNVLLRLAAIGRLIVKFKYRFPI